MGSNLFSEKLKSNLLLLKSILFNHRKIQNTFYLIKNIQKSLTIEKNESFRILNNFDKIKNFVIVYDFKSSPPTYGDFLWIVNLANYFSLYKKVTFIVIYGDYRNDWNSLKDQEIKNYIQQIDTIISKYLKQNIIVLKFKWNDFFLYKIKNDTFFYLFENKIIERVSIYNHVCNLTNILFFKLKNIDTNHFLLNKKPFKISNETPLVFKHPYITWHCRYNPNWGNKRNINKSDFLEIYNVLRLKYKNQDIVVVSDLFATMIFKNWNNELKLNLKFSQDLVNDFTGSADIILNSNFYFQYLGGGIGMVPILSNLPYLIIGITENEKMLKKNKLVAWANQSQIFTYSLPSIKEVKKIILNQNLIRNN